MFSANKSETESTASVLKQNKTRSKTHKKLKRTIFNWTSVLSCPIKKKQKNKNKKTLFVFVFVFLTSCVSCLVQLKSVLFIFLCVFYHCKRKAKSVAAYSRNTHIKESDAVLHTVLCTTSTYLSRSKVCLKQLCCQNFHFSSYERTSPGSSSLSVGSQIQLCTHFRS